MADELPRRAYPLVVPPPGGFEEAVRRGRGRRRKQTGSSSALALVMVGAIAYSVLGQGGGGGGAHLDPAQQPPVHHNQPVPSGDSTSAEPSASVTASPAPVSPTSTSTSGQVDPSAQPSVPVPDPGEVPDPIHPTRSPQPGRPYAPRAPITHTAPTAEQPEVNCLPAQNEDWCTVARGSMQNGGLSYLLEVAVCRSVAAGTADLHFPERRDADFKVTYIASNDTVWTYSLGQPVISSPHKVTFEGGECAVWQTVWDGNDDWSDLPPKGSYKVVATMNTTEALLPAESVPFEHD